jgi:hypothetical protein
LFSLPNFQQHTLKLPGSLSVHHSYNYGQLAIILLLDGNSHPHHLSGVLVLKRRLPVTVDVQVSWLGYVALAQALKDLAVIDSALLHPLLRVFRQDNSIAVFGDRS